MFPYALTIFVGAFLLFQVQPLMGRLVLPWFGGSAAVWTACLLFFQVVLLFGYLYAYALVRWLAPGRQAVTHIALLVASLGFMPLWPSSAWKPSGTEEPTLRILCLMTATVGLPYLLLASTSPLLQTWYVRLFPAGRPYPLFALSNLGSACALLGYVLLVEPRYPLSAQSIGWSVAYALFVAGASVCAWRARAVPVPSAQPEAAETTPTWGLWALWTGLSACGSLMLMSVTHYVSQNVAPVPFLWVGMLTVYLLTFIICFEGHNLYWRWLYLPLLIVALQQMVYYRMVGRENTSAWTLIPIFMGALFVVCMVCHGELARLRPGARWLTSFYLMLSLGGALGGLFTGVVAPLVFPGYFELDVGIVLCPVLLIAQWIGEIRPPWKYAKALAVGACVAATAWLAWFVAGQDAGHVSGHVAMRRNFYGVLSVTKREDGTDLERLYLTNGTITHGAQFTAASRLLDPTTYYGPDSGVGLAIMSSRGAEAHRVGVVGLGCGTLAAYARPGDFYRFYEINPLAVDMARHVFKFVPEARGRVEIVLGDARLSMERQSPQGYDVLAIDAFSSDAIPLHLLTLEAFAQYLRHLGPHGILAVHISNHYLDLGPVVRAAADHYGRRAIQIEGHDDSNGGLLRSTWILIGNDAEALKSGNFADGAEVHGRSELRPWTDDYANVLDILKDR